MSLRRIEENRPRLVLTGRIDQDKRLESILAEDITILGLQRNAFLVPA